MKPRLRTVTIASSGTPLEKEYRDVDAALARTTAQVTTFDPSRYDPRAVSRAIAAWTARMGAEHRSTTVFSSLAAQLVEANATLDAKLVMLRMAQDELRHTETCARVVAALGGEPSCVIDVSVAPLARHRGCTPEERALRNVIYTTCLSEMIAVSRLVDELDQTADPFLRDASRRLLADEVLHGQFGFHYLEAWRPWLQEHEEVIHSLERYLQHAFKVLEGALAGSRRASVLSDDERALGLPDGARAFQIFHDTIEHAVVPGLCRFGIDAKRAWKKRKLLDAIDERTPSLS